MRKFGELTIRDMQSEAAEMVREAAKIEDGDQRKAETARAMEVLKWALSSQKAQMVSNMVTLLKPHVEVKADIFDTHRMLFNCPNGTIDLKTGQLRPHCREDYLMQQSPVEYHPEAKAPIYDHFLPQIMLADDPRRPDYADRKDVVGYTDRISGYMLSGETYEQEWYELVGDGENGKSRLIQDAWCTVLGEYAGTLNPESVTLTRYKADGNAPTPDVAGLKGKRMVYITETAEGARIDAAKVKKYSGEDTLSGRHLHHNLLEFKPTFKMVIYTNHQPQVRETTHAFWRRVRIIPCEFEIKEHPELKDEKLGEKLQAEAEAAASARMVRGCLDWQENGLQPPKIVLQATEQYRSDIDPVQRFIWD